MTENEKLKAAIHCLGYNAEQEVCEECPACLDGWIACKEVARYGMRALEELQNYRKIGTVEECREAVEKQKPMKPDEVDYDFNYYKCQVCGGYIWSTDNVNKHRYCLECGQKIEWEEREEE